MKKITSTLLFFVASFGLAQCDSIADLCARHFAPSFISDGQQYRSLLLNSEEYSEFHTTFFGETTYRIAACSGTSDGNLIFNVYDQDRQPDRKSTRLNSSHVALS